MSEQSTPAAVSSKGVRFTYGIIKNLENNNTTLESAGSEISYPLATDFRISANELNVSNDLLSCEVLQIAAAQEWLILKGKDDAAYKFPIKTILSKQQLNKQVLPEHLPSDGEDESRRGICNKMDISEELAKVGLNEQELLPTEEQYYILSENAFKHFLPLSFFDNTDYDCHSSESWLKLGVVAEVQQRYPLPAKAFLPLNQSLMQYEWQNAAITDYDAAADKWTALVLKDEFVYQVPRIQIMFMAENPFRFVERVEQAVRMRQNAETLIMMEAVVHCVLWQNISTNSLPAQKLTDKLMAGIQTDKTVAKQLRLEIYLVHEHLMTCYEFIKFLKVFPQELPHLQAEVLEKALPKAYHSDQSDWERRALKALNVTINERKILLLKNTIFYAAKGIKAMLNVASECLAIETLTLFLGDFAKPLALWEFLNSQQKQSTKTSEYLKLNWPLKVSNGIISVLRPLGKGWLDISLGNWKVYKMCKIAPFILQVKFRMQESIQVLLEESINIFTSSLAKPCRQFLQLDEHYQWSNDFKSSEFPYDKPIFCLVLSVNQEQQEVTYSTLPEEFAPAIEEIFKKGLEMTAGVKQIDANCLTNLRFSSDSFILTVELIEDLYVRCSALLQECYLKAVYSLRAYAHKYDRFIEFYLLSVATYMEEYRGAQKSSMLVKSDILEHKRCKAELRELFPASITIGPFVIIVEPMKQLLIKKHTEIISKIFEYYIEHMYEANERMLDRCLEIYQKINDRPQSIEHLYAIKEFALDVPVQVDRLRADIQIMWIEYDMLDSFFYNLPDHQFAMKWQVYGWPKNILDRLSSLRDEQKNDIEDFKRLHLSECTDFQERLESLNDEVQQFSLRFNPQKVTEIAVEIKKIWKTIADLKKLGETLCFRQELFELEALSLEFLNNIIDSFLPYKNLWFACQDLVKLEEATIGNPLVNIELESVYSAIEVIRDCLNVSLHVFEEKTEIKEVARYFLKYLEDFIPKCNAIRDLKNENWLFLHWQELAARSGLDIKYSMAMNFQYCMRKGIMQHLELVHLISEKATNEADAIRRAFEEEERHKEEEKSALLMRKALRKCRRDIL